MIQFQTLADVKQTLRDSSTDGDLSNELIVSMSLSVELERMAQMIYVVAGEHFAADRDYIDDLAHVSLYVSGRMRVRLDTAPQRMSLRRSKPPEFMHLLFTTAFCLLGYDADDVANPTDKHIREAKRIIGGARPSLTPDLQAFLEGVQREGALRSYSELNEIAPEDLAKFALPRWIRNHIAEPQSGAEEHTFDLHQRLKSASDEERDFVAKALVDPLLEYDPAAREWNVRSPGSNGLEGSSATPAL